MSKKNGGYYFKAVYEVICTEFEKSMEPLFLTRPMIARLVSKKINIENGYEEDSEYTSVGVQTSVRKALLALEDDGKIIFDDDKYYYPNSVEAIRFLKRPELENLPFNEDGVFFVSPSTVLLSIRGLSKKTTVQEDEEQENDPVDSNICEKILDRKEVKKLFKDYLTDKHCFNVHINNNYVVLLIKGTVEEVEYIGEELKAIAKRSWELQHPVQMNFRKRRSSEQVAKEKAEKLARRESLRKSSKKEDASN